MITIPVYIILTVLYLLYTCANRRALKPKKLMSRLDSTPRGRVPVACIPLYRFSAALPGISAIGIWKELGSADVQISTWNRTTSDPCEKLRIITWNVWFDATLQELRYRHLIRILGENEPDVVCLQEVTLPFEKILRDSSVVRSKWLLTQLEDEQRMTGMRYGTIFLVRKALVMEQGCAAAVSFSPYPKSECGRGISILELAPPQRGPILIGNTHLEYTVSDRRAQMQFCIRALSSPSNSSPPVLSVLCGDTNIESYSEIADNFISSGYVDALIAANPPPSRLNNDAPEGKGEDQEESASALDLFQYMPTFGCTGIKFTNKASTERVGRLDYILCRPGLLLSNTQSGKPGEMVDTSHISESGPRTRQVSIHSAGLLGSEAFSNEVVKKEVGVDDPEMSVFPSDHVGVYAVVGVS